MSEKISSILISSVFLILLICGINFLSSAPEMIRKYKFNDESKSYIKKDNEGCTLDCSGHDAGYNWASKMNLVDLGDCEGGKSESFVEGCKDYIDERIE